MTSDKRVLVVEDEPLSREMLIRICRSHGHEVEGAEDGESAIVAIDAAPPSVVLLDVSMPGMSGLEVLRSIRERYGADRLPVIMVSARAETEDVVAGLSAGANDYVTKPVTAEILLARLQMALRFKQGVERLVAAERHRVMLDALNDTCRRLAQPMEAVLANLSTVMESLSAQDQEVRSKLEAVSDWAKHVTDLIERLDAVSQHRDEPYTEGMEGFIAASLESARKDDTPDKTAPH
jgi:DNA-binding response OmpR family regulator